MNSDLLSHRNDQSVQTHNCEICEKIDKYLINRLINHILLNTIDSLVYAIDTMPFGVSYKQWTVRWWKWLLSIPRSKNPALDDTGLNSQIGQKYKQAIFLCQTIENSTMVPNRNITLKDGKAVLMPIINWISTQQEDGENDNELKNTAKLKMDVVQKLHVTVNNMAFKNDLHRYRVMSPFFETELPQNNILDVSPGSRRFISDGYWLFFKPLNRPIKITSFGTCSSGVTAIAVNYQIDIIET